MATIIGLFEGGTTGARDGTLISYGDAETNPYAFAALNTVYTLHYRAIDSVTGLDPIEDSTGNIAPTCPAGVVASFTSGGTFVTSPTAGATIVTGGNKPLYVKQTALSETAALNLVFGSLTWTTGTRVAQVGTVTPTAGDASVALSWADISGETGYEVRRATDSGMTANVVTLTTSLAAGSTSYTNNAANGNAPSNGTTYYYQVRGYDANGVGPWSTAVSATPYALLDEFSGAAISTTNWQVITGVSGTATEGSGVATLTVPGATSAAGITMKAVSYSRSTERRYRMRFKCSSLVSGIGIDLLMTFNATSIPSATVNSTALVAGRRVYTGLYNNAGSIGVNDYCKNAAGTHTVIAEPALSSMSTSAFYYICHDVKQNGGNWQWRTQILDSAGTTTLYAGTWRNFSDTQAAANTEYLIFGDIVNDANYGTLIFDEFIVLNAVP